MKIAFYFPEQVGVILIERRDNISCILYVETDCLILELKLNKEEKNLEVVNVLVDRDLTQHPGIGCILIL